MKLRNLAALPPKKARKMRKVLYLFREAPQQKYCPLKKSSSPGIQKVVRYLKKKKRKEKRFKQPKFKHATKEKNSKGHIDQRVLNRGLCNCDAFVAS